MRFEKTLWVLVAAIACGSSPEAARPKTVSRSWIWGVTVDDVSDLDATVDSIRSLRTRPTVRVVFDENRPSSEYLEAVNALHEVGDIMGEILDSKFVAAIDVAEYRRRTREYVAALGDRVDIWEIGNEVNGDWLGPASEVVAKISAASEVVAGRPAALTFHYGCSDSEHEMFHWIEAHVTASLRESLAYVFVSYYEDDCGGRVPDWSAVFQKLGRIFPRAALGIGECGTIVEGRKATLLSRYYGMRPNEPRFIGGFFWWYFKRDMVPRERPLWAQLDALMVHPR